jgi:hypothetical protein
VAEGGEQTYSVKERLVDILRVIIPILVSGRQHQLLKDGQAEDVLDDVVVLGHIEVVRRSIVLRDDKGVLAVFLLQFVGSSSSEADILAGSYKRVVSTSGKDYVKVGSIKFKVDEGIFDWAVTDRIFFCPFNLEVGFSGKCAIYLMEGEIVQVTVGLLDLIVLFDG